MQGLKKFREWLHGQQTAIACGLLAGLALSCLRPQIPAVQSVEKLTVRELRIVDEHGKTRIAARTTPMGAAISLSRNNGHPVAWLTETRGGAAIVLCDEKGRERLTLGARSIGYLREGKQKWHHGEAHSIVQTRIEAGEGFVDVVRGTTLSKPRERDR